MKISMACDHGGYLLKEHIKQYLTNNGYQVVDFGTYDTQSCDYPDFASKAAQAVSSGECDKGVVVCTTGIGVSIVANKVKGVRCALCLNADMAEMTCRHNNANVLAMGAKYVDNALAQSIVDKFLSTEFEGGRHQRRLDKITALEKAEL